MEKVKQLNKENLLKLLSSRKAKYTVGTILLSGFGIALPRVFHVLAGSSAGATFLPMHFAVLIAALVFGALSATIVAGSSVICSYLLTGMPAIARMPYMIIELVIYAILLAILNKKMNKYLSLVITMILGRIIYAGVLLSSVNALGLASYGISVMESLRAGIPGLLLQIVFVPLIAKFLERRIKLDE